MSRQSSIEYGKLKTALSEIRDIRTYHDLFHEGPCCLDESEWKDLDMDDLFEFADRCITPVGEMLQYSKLHHMNVDPYADERELTAERIDSDEKFRKDVESSLSDLAGRKGDAVRHLLGMKVSLSRYHRFFRLLLAAEIAAIVSLWIFLPPAFAIIISVMLAVVNAAVHFWNKTYVEVYLRPLVQLEKLRKASVKLSSLSPEGTFGDVKRQTDEMSALSRKISIFGMGRVMESDLMMVFNSLIELGKMIFLVEPLYTYAILKDIEDISGSARRLIGYIGEWDTAYSTASLRRWMDSERMTWSRPIFDRNRLDLHIEDMSHPLIDGCVANSISIDKSVIITGSNMSGKSSFLKTIGINIATSYALGTCFATTMEMPCCRLQTVLSVSDDIGEGRSYYYSEALRIKSIIDRCRTKDNGLMDIVLIDEIFKGTNTIERISIADAVIRYLSALDRTYVLVSTHDIELARSFRETLDTYHFSESMHDGKLVFNYRLTPGVEYTRNAISILKNCGYPDEIIRNAESNTLKVSANMDSISL